MGRFNKRVIGGLTAALMLAAGGAFAQQVSVLDDFESGSNQNLFGDYWYFFDDNKEASTVSSISAKGSSVVYSADVKGTGNDRELLFTAAKSIDTSGSCNSGLCAKLEFKLGNTFITAYDNGSPDRARNPTFDAVPIGGATSPTCAADYTCGNYQFSQFVGIGTNLVTDGSTDAPAGFANATALEFYAKADAALSVWVFFEQSDIGWYPSYGANRKDGTYFGQWVTVTTQWTKYTIPLVESPCNGDPGKSGVWNCDEGGPGLRQPMFVSAGEQSLVKAFDKSKIVKVAWQVQAGNGGTTPQGNGNPAVGDGIKAGASTDVTNPAVGWENTLYLDDISFTGFTFVAPDMCMGCITSAAVPATATKLDKFADESPQNTLGYYWYFYDDTKAVTDDGVKGTSWIGMDGVEKDCASQWVDVAAGECEAIIQKDATPKYLSGEFELGKAIKIETNDVNPFVGIGTNLYDDKTAGAAFFDAATAGVDGLYFEYNTPYSSIRKVTFEVQDSYDAAGDRPAASVYYIDLPATGGSWFKAVVPFSKLVQHTGWETVSAWNTANPTKVALQTNALAKFQFKVQAGPGANGVLQLREVYLLGGSGSSVKLIEKRAASTGLKATYNRGVVGVNWNSAQNIASGKVSLVNVKGRTVASANLVKTGNKVTANLGKGTIPTGMYFVRINAKDVQGKKIVQQIPLSVVR